MILLETLEALAKAETALRSCREAVVMAVLEEEVGVGALGLSPDGAQEAARRFAYGSIAPWYEAIPEEARKKVLVRLEDLLGEYIER